MDNGQPVTLFYSYSHKDEALRQELENHLKILQREGYILPWHDRGIGAGNEWKNEINEHLKNARIILLLVSSDFIASDYCYDIEMQTALKMHDEGKAIVIPIILRDCLWQTAPFRKLQALPTDGKAITGSEWHNKDIAFTNAAKQLKGRIDELRENDKQDDEIYDVLESIQSATPSLDIKLKQIPFPKPYFA